MPSLVKDFLNQKMETIGRMKNLKKSRSRTVWTPSFAAVTREDGLWKHETRKDANAIYVDLPACGCAFISWELITS